MNIPWDGWLESGRFEASIANPNSSERASTSRVSNAAETPAIAGRSKVLPFAHVGQVSRGVRSFCHYKLYKRCWRTGSQYPIREACKAHMQLLCVL